MQILPYAEAQFPSGCRPFRNKSWLALFWAGVIMAGIAVFTSLPKGGNSSSAFAIMPGTFAVILFLLALERARVCMKERAWLLRVGDAGLFINLRSFHNYHLAEEAHRVLFVPKEEVAAVGKTHETLLVPNRRSAYKDQYSYIDIILKEGTDVSPLRESLRTERRLHPPTGWLRRVKRHDYPVRISDTGAIRLVWEWVKPNENRALDLLAQHYPLLPDRKSTSQKWEKMSEAEQEAFILELWEWGFEEDAIRLGKMKWSVGDYRAKKLLEEKIASL